MLRAAAPLVIQTSNKPLEIGVRENWPPNSLSGFLFGIATAKGAFIPACAEKVTDKGIIETECFKDTLDLPRRGSWQSHELMRGHLSIKG
ncbi:MAG: hypothetical protein ABI158_09370 [Edaphobacter sp.]